MPLIRLRIAALPLPIKPLAHQESRHGVPGHEHQIAVLHLIARQVSLAGFGEVEIDDAHHAFDFVGVALDG